MLIKTILITGANRGIGLELIKQFLSLDSPPKHVFAVCRLPEKAEELQKLASQHSSLHILGFELTEPSEYGNAVQKVSNVVGPTGLNLLINNAGTLEYGIDHLVNHTKESILKHFDVNIVSPVLLTKAFLPLLKTASSERSICDQINSAVVNVTSTVGCIKWSKELPGAFPYKYSKAALNMATYCLSEDLRSDNILVTALHPGWVRTDMGGPQGHISPSECARGCVNVLRGLTEEHRGVLVTWKGRIISLSNM